MKKIDYIFSTLIIILIIAMITFLLSKRNNSIPYIRSRVPQVSNTLEHTPTPTPFTLIPIPTSKVLVNNYYAKQTFNNCGPASLSIALSYYGVNITQKVLGDSLRPYQNPIGDNDDKSVTLDEMAKEAQKYGLLTYHKPNGDIELIKKFIAYDIPVITRTWLDVDDDIGHYRVVKGYDENSQSIVQDDSYDGPNLTFSYADFNVMWEKFDFEYLILVPAEKRKIAETIIGKNMDETFAWNQALKRNETKLAQNPSDIYSRFNLSIAYYYLKDYQKSVDEFEKIELLLPFRTLWYQNEPIKAYFMLGDYEKVFTITDKILNNHNRAYSELYILRGKIYQKQGNVTLAKAEFEKAVFYNINLQEANDALRSIY